MNRDLTRLLKPRSIAVIGGGAWCRAVIRGLKSMGYVWDVWPVHPREATIEGVHAYAGLDQLPHAPDAAFIGVNRRATVALVRQLQAQGAGGAICFASGFGESVDGAALNTALLDAARDMPIIGPNCYGYINALNRVALWPDIHGLTHVTRGVAILTQSSNIALNLTMQTRGLPIAYMATAGNQAQTGLAELGAALLSDDRVSALGLHIEGVGDLRAFEALAAKAEQLGKSVVVLKTGTSGEAQQAAISHTASLAGKDAGATALFERLDMARVHSLDAMLEALKLLHFVGPLPTNQIASLSCSGGEASLVADAAKAHGIRFAPLSTHQKTRLGDVLGPMVMLANPLDYHTFIWGNTKALAEVFADMMQGGAVLTLVIVDFPRADRCTTTDWDCVIEAAAEAHARVGMPLALMSSLPDTMPEQIAQRLIERGLIPFAGLDMAMAAISAAVSLGRVRTHPAALFLPVPQVGAALLDEVAAKAVLVAHGLTVPRSAAVESPSAAAKAAQTFDRVALKMRGAAHKTEQGGVALGLRPEEVLMAAKRMQATGIQGTGIQATGFLVEEMIEDGIVEVLIGIVADPAHGYVLTIAAGGVLSELWADSVSRLLPVQRHDVRDALNSLRIAPLFDGYRGGKVPDLDPVIDAVMALQTYVIAQEGRVIEVEVNPLIVTPTRALAADALIRTGEIE